MATLYVENVPEDIYKALRDKARKNRRSMAAEVTEMLERWVPTPAELKRRHKAYEALVELRGRPAAASGPFSAAEDMIREDRER